MHSGRPYDFRSDTVTLPTPAMMAAIAGAALGDAARGDDPTVNALERLAARLVAKDAAVFVPSGTMANLAALLAHEVRGGEVVVEATAHLYNSEGGGLSVVAGAVPRPLPGRRGALDPDDVRAAIRGGGDLALAPTRLVCVENTHNAAGGAVLPLSSLAALHGVCRDAGIPVHMDGARLFNAAAFLDVPVAEICGHVESVWFALCKGLGGPVGAILAGDAEFMQRARRAVKMLGGGMRQAGLIAAPALVALEAPGPALRRDHALARQLADGLAAIDESLVDAAGVQTNIVFCLVDRFVDRFGGDATAIAGALAERGVLANGKRNRIRFVTHAQVDEEAVEAAVAAVAAVIRGGRGDPTRQRAPMTEKRADAAGVMR